LRAIGTGIPGAGSNIVHDPIIVTPLRFVGPFVAIGVAALAGWGVRRHGRERLGFAVALAMAPFVGTSVWYPYLVMALPLLLASDGGRPRPDEAQRAPVVARVGAWLAIEARVDPLPLVGLLIASASGLVALFRPAPAEAARVSRREPYSNRMDAGTESNSGARASGALPSQAVPQLRCQRGRLTGPGSCAAASKKPAASRPPWPPRLTVRAWSVTGSSWSEARSTDDTGAEGGRHGDRCASSRRRRRSGHGWPGDATALRRPLQRGHPGRRRQSAHRA
jgi:hypothetical protein